MTTHAISCPVCGSTEYEILFKPWRSVTDPVKLFGAASGERGTQQIVRCQNRDCRMVYVNPRYPDEVILQGYEGADDQGHDSQYESRVLTFLRSLEKHRALLPAPGKKALDVGCAGGAFVDAARRFGYEAKGLEPSSQLTASARTRGLNVLQGTLESYHPSERYDLVSLWDVLEHVTDPTATLMACRELLNPGGVLLVNYPDVGTMQAKLAGRHFWWFLSVHLHYFDRHSIHKMLEKTGFQIFSVRRHFQRLELGYLFDVARIYNPTLAGWASRITPALLKRRLIPYYASQTTVLARLAS
jgi:2-polyprenyl-3-methyl-5-hydroxy-6-metoxy-1,4-benzoquinol methylase